MIEDNERIDEALHHETGADSRRDVHTGAENPCRVPAKPEGAEGDEDELPGVDLDQPTEALHERTRHEQH